MSNQELDLSLLKDFKLGNDLPVVQGATPIGDTQYDIKQILEFARILSEENRYAGFRKWFIPESPYNIDNLPKHKAFFEAGATHTERYFSAGNRCLLEGTLVATPRGPVPIEEIKEGDFVYDRYGHPTRVMATWDNGEADVVSLQNRGKEYLVCTPNHEMDAVRLDAHSMRWDPEKNKEVRVEADSLDRLDLVRRQYVKAPLGDIHEPHAYVIAAFIGDGCCTTGSVNRLAFSSADINVPAHISDILKVPFKKLNSNNYTYLIHTDSFNHHEWVKGKLAHEKTVDLDVVKTWSRESLLNFVAGLLDTDGSLSKSRDGLTLAFCNQSRSAIDAWNYAVLALWQEPCTVAVDDRPRYKNGPVFSSIVRNPHAIRRIADEIRPYLQHNYKADYSGFEDIGKRSRPEAIKLTPKPAGRGRVYDITVAHPEHFYLLANGISVSNCGKSISGVYETVLHLTGLYPDWWKGRRFSHATSGFALGDTSATVRNILQKELIGDQGPGTGMIPGDLIIKTTAKAGVSGAIETVHVRHVDGGTSVLTFQSYEQGTKAFYGVRLDFVFCDELPPEDIYAEAFVRTMTTNGIMYITATPLDGLTPLVLNFYTKADFLPIGSELPGIVKLAREDSEQKAKENAKRGIFEAEEDKKRQKAVIIASWDDAPWLSDADKKRILDSIPPNEREARSKGLPSMGSGTVYPIQLEEILIGDFPIPGHFKQLYGMDVGWNNTAALRLAHDPDNDTVYVCGEYKRGQVEPVVHAAAIQRWGEWLPGEIDPASRGRQQADGRQLFNIYRQLGLKLNVADNSVEAGIYAIWERLAAGKLKVFRSCMELQKEYITYRRDDKGRIIKENDHLLDCLRYGIQGLRHAKQKPVSSTDKLQGGNYGGRKYGI